MVEGVPFFLVSNFATCLAWVALPDTKKNQHDKECWIIKTQNPLFHGIVPTTRIHLQRNVRQFGFPYFFIGIWQVYIENPICFMSAIFISVHMLYQTDVIYLQCLRRVGYMSFKKAAMMLLISSYL